MASLVGLGAVSVGVVVLSWSWSIVGASVAVAGALLAWWAGVLRDVHGTGPLDELGEVLRGTVREGVAPGDTVRIGPEARERVVEVEARRRRLEADAGRRTSSGAPTGPAGVLLVLVAVFLLVAQWGLYPLGRPGQDNAVRALVAVVVLGIAGGRLLTAGARVPRIAAAFALLAGLGLVLNATLADHARAATAVAEAVCGAVSCLTGAGLLRRRR
ncbi:hypothetical protein [Nocardioides zeicaulis]|uniref:Uncharacterized protein n=1 Tax=Nocardioides zeicaulis TaxID=1776857 RepID=A0ABV6DWH7_9ACTN